MVVGVLMLEFTLHGNDSLKGKRKVASSLKQKLRNRFNVAAAEVESMDSLSRLVLSVVAVGNNKIHVESRLAKATAMVEAISPEELTDSSLQTIIMD